MEEKVVVIFRIKEKSEDYDLELPLSITANDLVIALNQAYHLGIDSSDVKQCYLKAENPICLLKGNRTLDEFGLRNGTIITY